MKVFLTLLVVVLMFSSLVACGENQEISFTDTDISGSTTESSTTIADSTSSTVVVTEGNSTTDKTYSTQCSHARVFYKGGGDYHIKCCTLCKAVLLTEPHILTLDKSSYREGTCEETGYAYYECLVCKAYTHLDELTVPHDSVAWKQEESASCLSPAKLVGECKFCGILLEKYEGEIAPHSYLSNGICKVCGESDSTNNTTSTVSEPYISTTSKVTTTSESTTTNNKPSTTSKLTTTTSTYTDVKIISGIETISGATIDTDIYIVSTGRVTFKDVIVNGNVYCYGQLTVSGGSVNNIYAYFWDLGGITSWCDAWDGTHGLVEGAFRTGGSVIIEDDALDYAFNKWGKK